MVAGFLLILPVSSLRRPIPVGAKARQGAYAMPLLGLNVIDPAALPPAQPVRLADLLEYAPGAVVSRVLAKASGGSVTLFAFEAGQELSEHTAPFDALVEVLDGEVVLVIGGKPVLAHAGETVLMPANVPHAVQARRRFKMLLTMVRQPTPA